MGIEQKNSGNRALQVGTIHGASVIHQGPVTYALTVINMVSSQRRKRRAAAHQIGQAITPHQVLSAMDRLPNRNAVLDFMSREFGTRLVIDLNAQQLYRVLRYVEVVSHGQ